jgi:hypothetical protein
MQNPSSLSDQIRQGVNDAVAGALAPARAELQAQLSALQAQQENIATLIRHAQTSQEKAELQAQFDVNATKIQKLQSGIDRLNRQLTTRDGPPATIPIVGNAPRIDMDHFNPAPMVIAIVSIIFIGFPLAIAFTRLLWRRATHGAPPAAALTAEQARRFDRLEQSVDAIAIEIERISENQRYLTRVLSEPKQGASVGSGS